ncbi:hypothetical protein HKB23_33880, partial [Vibrio parahaemolyticus]|nr:hypothetical protein [Vibrio parahaemolyticus]
MNREAKEFGLSQIEDLLLLEKIATVQKLKSSIEEHINIIGDYSVWKGWDTSHEILESTAVTGKKIREIVSNLVSLTDEPSEILI